MLTPASVNGCLWCGIDVPGNSLGILHPDYEHQALIPRNWNSIEFLISDETIIKESLFPEDLWWQTFQPQHALFTRQAARVQYIKIHGIDKIISCLGGADIVYFSQYSTMEEKKMEEMIIFVFADTHNIRSLTVVEMYDPLATMERVTEEGIIATSNVDAHFWKTLPQLHSGRKIMRILYDHHTLQNRFYFTNGTTHVFLGSAIPTLLEQLATEDDINTVAFPDEGAYKRFNAPFSAAGFDTVVCGKKRIDDKRIVTINEGSPSGKRVIIVDDLVRSGGTLIQCMKALNEAGALSVSIFVTHAQFPQQSWKRFLDLGDELDTFYITDTIPRVSDEISKKNPFQLLSLRKNVELQIELNTSLQ